MCMPYELSSVEIGYFHDAIATDPHSGGLDVVSNLVMTGAMELWVFNEDETILVTITRVVTYPDGYRELLVQMMAGTAVTSTDAHLECERVMMRYALKQGAQRMVAYMRPDIWNHMKGPLGERYVQEYVVLSLAPGAILVAPGVEESHEDQAAHPDQTHSETRGNQDYE